MVVAMTPPSLGRDRREWHRRAGRLRIGADRGLDRHARPQPRQVFGHVVKNLARYPLAYIHIIEGATGGPRDHQQGDQPFDYDALRSTYVAAGGKAAWMTNNGYDRALAVKTVKDGEADLVAFGKPFIANPDLVERLKRDAPLNTPDQATFYGGGAKGYTDYPFLDTAEA